MREIEQFERSRMNFIRAGVGLVLGGLPLLAACGSRPEMVLSEDASAGEPVIDGAATANAIAVRGGRTQEIPLPALPPTDVVPYFPGELIRSVRTGRKVVMLTFDDGPDKVHDLAVANILKDRGYEGKATFFHVGINALASPNVTKELFDRGYEIGNHTLRHDVYTGSGEAAQIAPTQDVLLGLTGVLPRFFRSAGLTISDLIQQECARLGLPNIFTDGDEQDWLSPRKTADIINANFRHYLHPGYISLRHTGGSHDNTVAAMNGTIDYIEEQGYEIIGLYDGLSLREDGVNSKRVQTATLRTESMLPHFSDTADGLPGIELSWGS